MSVEIAGVVALVFVLAAFGVSVGLSLMGAAVVGVVLTVEADKLAPFMGTTMVNALTTYAILCAVLLIVLGALLEHTGTVLGLPACPGGASADPDRSPYFAGGALGLPLPVAAPLVFVGLLTETSIGRLTVVALPPGLALSALYLLIYGLSRLIHRPPLELGAEPDRAGAGALAIVLRCVVPVVGAAVFIGPIQAGVLTPTEAAGLLVVIGLIFVLALFLASRRAQARAWPGLAAGVAAAARFALILVGITIVSQLFALGSVPKAVTEAVIPLGLDARGLIGVTAAVALVAGTILGPLAAIGLAAAASFGTLTAAGIEPLVPGVVLFLTAEAIRVGPRLWRGGFIRPGRRAGGGPGSWPNYIAAVAVIAGYIVVFA